MPRPAEIGATWPTYSVSPREATELKSKRPNIENDFERMYRESPLPKVKPTFELLFIVTAVHGFGVQYTST